MWACDVCGCSISGLQFGILPQFQKHFVGMRYSTKSFTSIHPPLFTTDSLTTSLESFNTVDLWGRMAISNRWQVFGFLPINFIHKVENGILYDASGLGDVSIVGLYSLINQKKSKNIPLYQNLQIGGGIKLPSGSYQTLDAAKEWIPGVQLGSGSVDFLLNVNYIVKYQHFGASLEANARLNQQNDLSFKFGNRYASTCKVFYRIDSKKNVIMPNLGLTFESSNRDYHEGAFLDLSGGKTLFGQIGVDYFAEHISMGLHYQPSIYQDVAQGNIISSNRFSAQILYLF